MRASVLERVTIGDVLRAAGMGVVVRGRRMWFRCPAHADTHPSAVVVGERGFRCFACGARGGVLDLVVALGLAADRAAAARFLELEL